MCFLVFIFSENETTARLFLGDFRRVLFLGNDTVEHVEDKLFSVLLLIHI